MNGIEDRAEELNHFPDSCILRCDSDQDPDLSVDDISTTNEGVILFTGRNDVVHIKALMPRNQSFDQSLYAALTRAPLPCRSQVHFPKDGVHWPGSYSRRL
jgi:hypothetical protein